LASSRAHGSEYENHVIDPASIHVDRRARRIKTDRIDAQALLRTLLAHRRGEGRVWSVVQPPTPEDEDRKRPHRERQNLLKERGRHVNRIKVSVRSRASWIMSR
jgi:transposase